MRPGLRFVTSLAFCALMLLPVGQLEAKTFTSQYCEFELPPGWECALEGTEWVCQSENKERRREAIIILAAKVRGQQDSNDQYLAYLKQRKTFTLPGGKTQVSEAKYAKINDVNGHQWVDALHLASEVPGFYTRYLATVKEDLGVAVTFSVAKDHYAQYQSIFDRIVATLKVFRQKADANFKMKDGKEDDLIGNEEFIPEGANRPDIGSGQRKGSGSGTDTADMILYIVLAGGAGAVLLKLKKGKKKKKKKSSGGGGPPAAGGPPAQ